MTWKVVRYGNSDHGNENDEDRISKTMKLCTPTELKKITGTRIPAEQVAALRQRGLNPFVCPKTGSPIIAECVILESMLGKAEDSVRAFNLNEEAFK